ncbi:VOC family protein [Sphingomonas sp. BT-65]|uniref:VOC family protein n=1 Tax=Sphingomonas sp. BT-65 TaxID=2989821 RepID=UPI0022369A09|nr:VOC family protein [Sphingomonas sp. BT-65]MCW4461835.1 VOC family protein [Sphingomonas sp. BT-65]
MRRLAAGRVRGMIPSLALECRHMQFPQACPEVPVADLASGLAYYRDRLGFTEDWSDLELGLAGVSRGDARLFLADAGYRATLGNDAPILLWINLANRDEVDALHAQWQEAGVAIPWPPTAQPYKLYEFFARDDDGNHLRVFYDFGWEESG